MSFKVYNMLEEKKTRVIVLDLICATQRVHLEGHNGEFHVANNNTNRNILFQNKKYVSKKSVFLKCNITRGQFRVLEQNGHTSKMLLLTALLLALKP